MNGPAVPGKALQYTHGGLTDEQRAAQDAFNAARQRDSDEGTFRDKTYENRFLDYYSFYGWRSQLEGGASPQNREAIEEKISGLGHARFRQTSIIDWDDMYNQVHGYKWTVSSIDDDPAYAPLGILDFVLFGVGGRILDEPANLDEKVQGHEALAFTALLQPGSNIVPNYADLLGAGEYKPGSLAFEVSITTRTEEEASGYVRVTGFLWGEGQERTAGEMIEHLEERLAAYGGRVYWESATVVGLAEVGKDLPVRPVQTGWRNLWGGTVFLERQWSRLVDSWRDLEAQSLRAEKWIRSNTTLFNEGGSGVTGPIKKAVEETASTVFWYVVLAAVILIAVNNKTK